MDKTPEQALADLLSSDELRRVETYFGVLHSQMQTMRGLHLAISGLIAEYGGEHYQADAAAAKKLVIDAINALLPHTKAVAAEWQRISSEKDLEAQRQAIKSQAPAPTATEEEITAATVLH